MGKTYILKNLAIPNDVNLLVLSTHYSYSNAITTRLNLKLYYDIDGNINLSDHKRIAKRIIVIDNNITDLNIEWIKTLYKDKLFSIIHNTYQSQKGKTFCLASNKKTVLIELWKWVKQISLLSFKNRTSISLICYLRKNVQGIIHALKTDFSELRIKEYYDKSDPVEKAHDFSNIKESLKDVDLVAYTSTLKIGVSFTNPKLTNYSIVGGLYVRKFQSYHLFGWRMIDFLRKAGICISIVEPISKPEDNMISLSQTVKTAKFLKNKPKKTLEEICSLDQYHIADCYAIPPELLTEEFISKYGNFNHMKWLRAYRQLRDA
ncbi:17034_t:CDS:2, partial [Funneliformis geosporum]